MPQTLDFPTQRPPSYIKLENEPVFDAARHLDLGRPDTTRSLYELGYSADDVALCPSEFGVCPAFKILSDEGLAVMREICATMYGNRNLSIGTGANRLGSYVRGAGYRSQFIKDFCDSPEPAIPYRPWLAGSITPPKTSARPLTPGIRIRSPLILSCC